MDKYIQKAVDERAAMKQAQRKELERRVFKLKEEGLSQATIARRLGIPATTVSNILFYKYEWQKRP